MAVTQTFLADSDHVFLSYLDHKQTVKNHLHMYIQENFIKLNVDQMHYLPVLGKKESKIGLQLWFQ